MFNPRDPDANLLVLFKTMAIPNAMRTAMEGRPIFDDVEVAEVRIPGSRSYGGNCYPATSLMRWDVDPVSGEQKPMSWAECFPKQYAQYKSGATQTKSGTPLAAAPFLTEGRRAELRALNVLTVEQLALIDGQELKNLGGGGRDLKNRAQEYMADAKRQAPSTMLLAELEAMRAKNAVLAEDNAILKQAAAIESEFEDMTDKQLRELITSNTGREPIGELSRKTLLRMAVDTKVRAA